MELVFKFDGVYDVNKFWSKLRYIFGKDAVTAWAMGDGWFDGTGLAYYEVWHLKSGPTLSGPVEVREFLGDSVLTYKRDGAKVMKFPVVEDFVAHFNQKPVAQPTGTAWVELRVDVKPENTRFKVPLDSF